VHLVCAIALMLVGFAHQPPVINTSSGTIDVSQYVLPDGSLPIFCITDNGGDEQSRGKMHMVHGCDACQITASILLPMPADEAGHAMQFAAAIPVVMTMDVFGRPLYPPNTGPTGPPAIS
jgi:hypothetical protein